MNAILIHNDNIITSTLDDFKNKYFFKIAQAKLFDKSFNIDTEIFNQLDDILIANSYDVIFIPFSLTSNYIEYLGVRIALHIRLTPEWKHQKCPIVFIGVESREQVAKLTNFGGFLFTSGIYNTSKQEYNSITDQYNWIINNKKELNDKEYNSFIENTIIQPPANFSSHHSITNEWNIYRWAEMAKISEELRDSILNKVTFRDTLYFKFLNINLNRERVEKKKEKKDLTIAKNKEVKIYYIDDEVGKGWGVIFQKILFHEYGENFEYYNKFSDSNNREDLLLKLNQTITAKIIDGFNLFIVDLRLCDEDFEEKTNSNFTGVKLITEIKRINPGVQVVVFTASNKSKNVKLCLSNGADDYIEKESPSLGLNRISSYEVNAEFTRAVNNASKKVFLAMLYNDIQKIILDDYVKSDKNLTTILKGRLSELFYFMKKNENYSLNSALTLCFSILDYILKDQIVGSDFHKMKFIKGQFDFQLNDRKNIIDVDINGMILGDPVKKSDLAKAIYFLRKSDLDMKKMIELRFLRNNLGGHYSGEIDIRKRQVTNEDILLMINIIHYTINNISANTLHTKE